MIPVLGTCISGSVMPLPAITKSGGNEAGRYSSWIYLILGLCWYVLWQTEGATGGMKRTWALSHLKCFGDGVV